jgi:hypothetical protein
MSLDRRGRGDSGDTQPYSVEREVDDIAPLIEHEGGTASLYVGMPDETIGEMRRGPGWPALAGAGARG